MPRRATEFQTIRSEGGLFPPDLLRRIVDPAGKVAGVEPTAYGLPAGERINEAITQSWNRLRRHWAEFRAAVAPSSPVPRPFPDAFTGLTNDKWSLPLLRELGFGFLATTAGPTMDGKTYAISRFAGATPIHLVGCGVDLDRRAAGVRGAAVGNPHGLVQEFLNRNSAHVWGIVSNGFSLRILRDNQALSRQSFLEFDLEAMFDGEVYSDFVLLWLVAHASRFLPRNDGRPDSCWLETWSKEAAEQGVAALTDLRGGVEKALEILGQGFVSHPKNTALRDALREGDVKLSDFHHQLLRVVYRLIFLFVAEDRQLEGIPILHPPIDVWNQGRGKHGGPPEDSPSPPSEGGEGRGEVGASVARAASDVLAQARERYITHYSTSRLRELASRIKGSRHGDLWRQFQLLVGALSGDARFAAVRNALALPPLGSMLWNPADTALLNGPGISALQPSTLSPQPSPGCELSNHDFLEALRHLAFIRKDKILRPVDYKNLGSEEFGGIYESFLALTPQISSDGARFTFAEFAGNERKTSGSYYTPDSLVQCLLDSALDPVVEARLADAERLAKLDWAAVEKEIQSDPAKRTYVLAFLTKHAGASKTASSEERKRAWDSVAPTPRRWKLSEEGILAIKVCDMACGSGHFLVGAGHRLARHLARVRALAAGESEPSPLLYQTALRDVIGRCLYGVDINPMAVELCKVTLWLEALEPGKPLSFLDHHIRCGNSLLGATPELIAAGLPDEAFDPIEGDDKAACSSLKKLNRAQREGLRHLFIAEDNAIRDRLRQTAAAIDEMGDTRPEDIQRKEAAFRAEQSNYAFQKACDLANLWCAAFVIKKQFPASASKISNLDSEVVPWLDAQPLATQGGLFGDTEELPKAKGKKAKAPRRADSENAIGITTQHLRDFVESGALREGLLPEARRLATKHQFFHWHLAFPEVFAHGGFDVFLSNPPWERTSFEEIQFFSMSHPSIAAAVTTTDRRRMIQALEEANDPLYQDYVQARRASDEEQAFLIACGKYPLTAVARLDMYALLTELAASLVAESGMVGLLLPTGIATAIPLQEFWVSLFSAGRVRSLVDFENRAQYFPGVDSRKKFCLLTFAGHAQNSASTVFSFFTPQATSSAIRENSFSISPHDIAVVNPTSRQPPVVPSPRDLHLLLHIHRKAKNNAQDTPGWVGYTSAGTGDTWVAAGDTPPANSAALVPLVEGKMVHQFDHRFATYEGCSQEAISKGEPNSSAQRRLNPAFSIRARFVVPSGPAAAFRARKSPYTTVVPVYRDYTSATNERTMVAAVFGQGVPMQPLNGFSCLSSIQALIAVARLNSFVVDYVARLKTPDIHLNVAIFNQLPGSPIALLAQSAHGMLSYVRERTLELTYTAWDLESFAQDCGWIGPPFRWDEERRFLLRCELDAAFFHLYLGPEAEWRQQPAALTQSFPTPRDAVSYIMDTFPIVKRKDEEKCNGDYRTKRTILEVYNALGEAVNSGMPYRTRLNPPPADLRCCHPPRPTWQPS